MENIYFIVIPLIVSLIGISVPAIRLFSENKKLKTENKDLKKTIIDSSFGIYTDLKFFNDIKDTVENIFINTKADRFLILSATNGTRDFRFATAIYEHYKKTDKVFLSVGAVGKYVRFEFDSHYKELLKSTEVNEFVDLSTEKMQESDLKQIYLTEEIKHSRVYFLLRSKIDAENDRIFYCSASTHSDNEYTPREKTILKIQLNKLKNLFQELEKENNGR